MGSRLNEDDQACMLKSGHDSMIHGKFDRVSGLNYELTQNDLLVCVKMLQPLENLPFSKLTTSACDKFAIEPWSQLDQQRGHPCGQSNNKMLTIILPKLGQKRL